MPPDWLPYTASLDDFERAAVRLLAAANAGEEAARAQFKWEHPRYRGKPVADVDAATLDLVDARIVVAHRYAFDNWPELLQFTEAVVDDPALARFEAAAEAVVHGDVTSLRALLRQDPALIGRRSTRRHHAMLLHYIAANGIEGGRQRTPANAVEVLKALLDAGAEVDAFADTYEGKWTTMGLLVSSDHPAKAGLQARLAGTLVDYGASLRGDPDSQAPLAVALAFGYLETAQALAARGAPVESLVVASGLGRYDAAVRLLSEADAQTRHIALALAAQHGHGPIVRLLLDAGEDPSRFNPEGYHSHSTPLHQAVWAGHAEVVELLVSRGAPLDRRDTIHLGTPLDWAEYGGRTGIAGYLRRAESSTS